ncbi:MAG: hypothetical protein KKF67_03590 [Nanoarchaeota archaeon]|nr:hypothetical protein [Nanoarchaeota archaeon]
MENKESFEELPEHYKIVKVKASDMQSGYACYFIASSVEMAERKADMMTYRNPRGEEFALDENLRNERYFNYGFEHARNHKPCGNPICDAFLICCKRDDEKESKSSIERKISDAGGTEEEKSKREFYKILMWSLIPK